MYEEFIDGSKNHAAGWIGFYWGKPPDELRRFKDIGDALTLGWLELFERKGGKGRETGEGTAGSARERARGEAREGGSKRGDGAAAGAGRGEAGDRAGGPPAAGDEERRGAKSAGRKKNGERRTEKTTRRG